MNEEIKDYLTQCSTQRAGFAAIISGILSVECTDEEAVALQLTTANILIDIINRTPAGDEIEKTLLQTALDFAEKGIMAETAKAIINGGE